MKLVKYFNLENLTIPNVLSLLRILLIPLIIYLFYLDDPIVINYIAIPLIMIAMATDFFDGYLARKLNQITDLGKILDPIADKIAIISISLFFYFEKDFPLWLVLAIIIRDILIIIGATVFIEKKDVVIPSNLYGKMTTGVIFFLFITYVFNLVVLKLPLEVLSGVMIVISFVSYVRNFYLRYTNEKNRVE